MKILFIKSLFFGFLLSAFVAFSLVALNSRANPGQPNLPKSECVRNSDCLRGLACVAGKCAAECIVDQDCPTLGNGFECLNTLEGYRDAQTNLPVPLDKGGGVNANQCVPRMKVKICEKPTVSVPEPKCEPVKIEFGFIPKLDRVYPEISENELSGNGFWSFAIFNGDPQVCARECAKWRDKCRAWTLYKEGQGEFPRCWLRNTVGLKVPNENATSGVVR